MKRFAFALASVVLLTVVCLAGCAQTAMAPADVTTPQGQVTPTVTDQAAATDGDEVTANVYVLNTSTEPPWGGDKVLSELNTNGLDGHTYAAADPAGGDMRTNVGYTQHGIDINFSIVTGGTTPSLTGTTTGSATQTAKPTAYPSTNATQDIRPRVALDVPIGVAMPGGIADVAGSAGAGEGTVSLEKQSENLLRWAQIYGAEAERMQAWADLVQSLLNGNEDAVAGDSGSAPADVGTNGTTTQNASQ